MSPLTISKRYNKYKLCSTQRYTPWAPQTPTCLEVFMTNNLVTLGDQNLYVPWFWGAHGRYILQRNLMWRPSTYVPQLPFLLFPLRNRQTHVCSMYGHPDVTVNISYLEHLGEMSHWWFVSSPYWDVHAWYEEVTIGNIWIEKSLWHDRCCKLLGWNQPTY